MRVYAPSGDLVDGCIAAIESMTKEAEVGDKFTRQGREDHHLRRLRRAVEGHRRPAPHLQRQARRAGRVGRGRASARATSSTSPWSRSTASAAGSACGSPTTPRSRASRPRSSPRSAPATAAARGGGGGRDGGRDRGGRGRERGGRGRDAAVARPRPAPTTELPEGVSSLSWTRLRVVTEERCPSVRSVALGLWVRTGSRDEAPEEAGVSHFLEHLLFKGTPSANRRSRSPSSSTDGRGGERRDEQGVDAPPRAVPRRAHRGGVPAAARDVAALDARRARSTPSARSCSRRSRCTRTSPRTASTTCSPRPVYGDHPLGRRVLGCGRGDRLGPGAGDRRLPRRSATVRQRSSSRRPATSTTSAIVELAEAHLSAPSGEADGSRARPPERRAPRFMLPREGHGAVPHLLRRPGHFPRRRPPLRARGARRHLRRLDLVAPLPRDPREAGPRLRGRLLHRAVHRHRHGRACTSGRERTTSSEACEIIGRELGADLRGRRSAPRS